MGILILEIQALARVLNAIFTNDYPNVKKYRPETLINMLNKRVNLLDQIYECMSLEIDIADLNGSQVST